VILVFRPLLLDGQHAMSETTPISPRHIIGKHVITVLFWWAWLLLSFTGSTWADSPDVIRVATFNLEDVRTEDVLHGDHPRLKQIAAIIQEIRPDVILLTEIAYNFTDTTPGQNGQRFAENYLAVAHNGRSRPLLAYDSFMAPTNTGIPSGLDLDNDGRIVTQPGSRGYGNDCWGYGTFPGQYAMALLVRNGLTIEREKVRTFRDLRWSCMPGALAPLDPETGQPWYTAEAWAAMRLSSKSHWDVPVRLESGQVVHMLCSHPTPPVFDGPEDRNGCRNHDEIRFWNEYLSNADWIVDDGGKRGGLDSAAEFVILGDLNADPDRGDSRDNPIGTWLFAHPRVQGDFVPRAKELPGESDATWNASDTATWGLRVDYVLPSRGLRILDGGVIRPRDEAAAVSDHFPVWLDLQLPRVFGP
jgi:endonuclease/exonuclease/phosphatase family metal-dependent hydrolase